MKTLMYVCKGDIVAFLEQTIEDGEGFKATPFGKSHSVLKVHDCFSADSRKNVIKLKNKIKQTTKKLWEN